MAFRLDGEGRFTEIEGKGLEDAGLTPAVLLGRSAFDVFARQPDVVDPIRRALAGEEMKVVVPAWSRWWSAHLSPVRAGPEVTGVIALWMDTTAREETLARSQRQLKFAESVLEHVPSMIFVKDAVDLRFVRFNRAAESLIGHTRTEMLGKNDYDFFPPTQADFFTAKDRAVLASGKLVEIPEEPIETRNGRRYLRTKKIPILSEAGIPLYLIGISEDITDWRELDEERRKVLDRLLDLDHLKAQLIANVSHELRTPLTVILLLTERLMRDLPPESERTRDLNEIDRSARTLLALVKDLLDASKLESGRLSPEYANVDLALLVRLTAASLDSMARAIPVDLVVDVPPTLPAQVDPERVQHILTNLLSNAFKHAPPSGIVRCSLETIDGIARFTVADSGPGVPMDLRSMIFDRFFQAPGDAARVGGTGLGLAIVKDFAELHGGRVAVGDAPEGGALFVVEIPLVAPPDAIVRAAAQLVPPPTPPIPTPASDPATMPEDHRPSVLLVEDHPDMRRLLVDELTRRYRVVVAVDGKDALERARQSPPDLILTDLMMPRMTGDELVREVRSDPALASVSIIVLTARDDDDLRVELLRGGAQDFVTKPFSSEELVARIDNAVTIKRTRELLQGELESGRSDIEVLARDLAQRGHELKTAYADASVARRRAEASSHAKSEFLALVSHELRSPMTALRLRLDMLSRARAELLAPAQATLVTRMTIAAERLYAIAQSLVDLVGVETGEATLRFTPIDVLDLLASVLDASETEARAKGLVTRVEAAPVPRLESDEHLVRMILSNLIGNAVKFTMQGEIVVRVAIEDRMHVITVEDTGPGIPEEARARIFEPFQHVEPLSHKHTPGAGVGLAIVRRAVEALGGTIDIAERSGGGTIFTVALPTRRRSTV